MHIISGNTLTDTVLQAYKKILNEGYYHQSRNGGSRALYDVTAEIKNPRSRHLNLKHRKSNIFQMIAETFWVMSGDDRLDPYLSYFLPRAKEYSDDGQTWYSAYGPRLYMFDQLQGVIDTFKTDDYMTRRAYLSIQMPHTDAPSVIADVLEGEKPKDISCNQMIQFYVIDGNKFTTKVIQRSGDIIFGTGSINPFEFSMLHELMYNEVKKIHPALHLGPYRWHVTNMHLYDFTLPQAHNAVQHENNWTYNAKLHSNVQTIGPELSQWKSFFTELVETYSYLIEYKETLNRSSIEEALCVLNALFEKYSVPMYGNQLYTYAMLIAYYIASKEGIEMPRLDILYDTDSEFYKSVFDSSFRKFEM